MIPIVLVICVVLLICLALLLRYESFAKREPEHGVLEEPLWRGLVRGLRSDVRRVLHR